LAIKKRQRNEQHKEVVQGMMNEEPTRANFFLLHLASFGLAQA